MIVNKGAAGYNCNACYILFGIIQYIKYHIKEKKSPTPIVSQEANFGKHQTQIVI